ncbi:hypothetical protein SUGI_0118600 [Cryptomeria japonica]|nr:hypothetical protein SUGI_0118600 [Cryptomeria japonica]
MELREVKELLGRFDYRISEDRSAGIGPLEDLPQVFEGIKKIISDGWMITGSCKNRRVARNMMKSVWMREEPRATQINKRRDGWDCKTQ